MDTFVCSSWYYLRFIDPHNDQNLASADLLKKWLPVDVYLGGAEHTVLHLLYARFFMKALQKYGGLDLDQKYVEPFYKLRHQGMILGEDGNKMSKSKGNVINPDEVVNEYGADTLRLYEMFMGALEDMKPWNTKNILGVRRFLEKVWNLQEKVQSGDFPEVEKVLHRTIKKVGDDILAFGFNTAISQMMIFANTAKDGLNQNQFERFLKILSPFAPHLSEELWALLSHETFVAREAWPSFDEAFLQDDTVSVGIQINGKLRDTIEFDKNLSEAEVKELVLAREKVQKWLEGQELKKFIYVSGKIINIVIG
jgi:leucyl-tRNA synthetase